MTEGKLIDHCSWLVLCTHLRSVDSLPFVRSSHCLFVAQSTNNQAGLENIFLTFYEFLQFGDGNNLNMKSMNTANISKLSSSLRLSLELISDIEVALDIDAEIDAIKVSLKKNDYCLENIVIRPRNKHHSKEIITFLSCINNFKASRFQELLDATLTLPQLTTLPKIALFSRTTDVPIKVKNVIFQLDHFNLTLKRNNSGVGNQICCLSSKFVSGILWPNVSASSQGKGSKDSSVILTFDEVSPFDFIEISFFDDYQAYEVIMNLLCRIGFQRSKSSLTFRQVSFTTDNQSLDAETGSTASNTSVAGEDSPKAVQQYAVKLDTEKTDLSESFKFSGGLFSTNAADSEAQKQQQANKALNEYIVANINMESTKPQFEPSPQMVKPDNLNYFMAETSFGDSVKFNVMPDETSTIKAFKKKEGMNVTFSDEPDETFKYDKRSTLLNEKQKNAVCCSLQ